jgi:DNA-directed RNA polymerase specialized sigma24 family protein
MTETSTPPAMPNRRPTNEELRALVDEHGAAIYRVAIGIVRDPALAEDVV